MRQNKGYLLTEINNIPHLLPYGQMIADQKRGMQINATGAYLWKQLEEDLTMEDLLLRSAAYYEIPAAESAEFEKDISTYIKQLMLSGIIVEDARDNASVFYEPVNLLIGGLNLQIWGPSEAVPSEWKDFVIDSPEIVHQKILLHMGPPSIRKNGLLLIRNEELVVMVAEEEYIFLFPASAHIEEIHLKKDGTLAHCYCMPPYSDDFRYDLFHALRLVYLYLAQRKGMIILHSASLLYREKAWLFSGHSGMGKSTHTNLWKELYDISLINGDLNLLAFENGQPVVHGIPWCGTSGICTTKTYPLGGIILIQQAPTDRVEELSTDRKQLLVTQRLISPSWTPELFLKNLELVEKLSKDILVCKLHCTKNPSAAEIMKGYIDEYLEGR